ncbi:MAG: DUF4926 domain-containing protein [Phycisphaerae bacterium]|nr:DUF4926 domain-containing protein [Phycisphaerae bacterium]
MPREHDVVALTANRPEDSLRVGDVGAVVHCYRDRDVYEVEFIDEQGRTKCVATVPASQIMKLNLLSLSA